MSNKRLISPELRTAKFAAYFSQIHWISDQIITNIADNTNSLVDIFSYEKHLNHAQSDKVFSEFEKMRTMAATIFQWVEEVIALDRPEISDQERYTVLGIAVDMDTSIMMQHGIYREYDMEEYASKDKIIDSGRLVKKLCDILVEMKKFTQES